MLRWLCDDALLGGLGYDRGVRRSFLNDGLSLLHESPHVCTHEPRSAKIISLVGCVALFIEEIRWRSELIYLRHPVIIDQLVVYIAYCVDQKLLSLLISACRFLWLFFRGGADITRLFYFNLSLVAYHVHIEGAEAVVGWDNISVRIKSLVLSLLHDLGALQLRTHT